MQQLATVIQELSLARNVTTVMAIVRHAARELTGADGASFVLREGDLCYYADEEAIEPLWKGQRFPMSTCISGWVMLHRQHAIIEDIYRDPRIPAAAYQPTFVHSLVMVPIRQAAPLGAIGTYWAQRHQATLEEVQVVQALADSTSVTLENLALTAERQRLDREVHRAQHFAQLGRLAAGISHEIRNPLGAIRLHADLLEEELRDPAADSPAVVTEALTAIKTQLARVDDLVQDYLSLARVAQSERTPQDLGGAVQSWATEWQTWATARGVRFRVEGLAEVGEVPVHLSALRRALLNLVQNALEAMPQGGTLTLVGHRTADSVSLRLQDTGQGIPRDRLPQLFEPLYTTKPGGTGLGLAIVREILTAHGGHVTVDSVEGQGTTFTLSLPVAMDAPRQERDFM